MDTISTQRLDDSSATLHQMQASWHYRGIRRDRKRKQRTLIAICLAFVLLVGFILPGGTAVFYYESYFGSRLDKSTSVNSVLDRWTEFPNMTKMAVSFPGFKQTDILRGYLYVKTPAFHENNTPDALYPSPKGLIFYLNDLYNEPDFSNINQLVQADYWVLCWDYTGSGESGGQSIAGLAQGTKDLLAAFSFVQKDEKLAPLPVYLYGEGSGSYSACTVLQQKTLSENAISGIVAAGGYDRPLDVLVNGACEKFGGIAHILRPYLAVWQNIRQGNAAGYSASQTLAFASVPVFVIPPVKTESPSDEADGKKSEQIQIPLSDNLTLYERRELYQENSSIQIQTFEEAPESAATSMDEIIAFFNRVSSVPDTDS